MSCGDRKVEVRYNEPIADDILIYVRLNKQDRPVYRDYNEKDFQTYGWNVSTMLNGNDLGFKPLEECPEDIQSMVYEYLLGDW